MTKNYILTLCNFLVVGVVAALWVACKSNPFAVDISNISIPEVKIIRFEQSFYRISNEAELHRLRQKYPFFFSASMTDAAWLKKAEDEDELRLFLSVSKRFEEVTPYEKQITDVFRYVKYYYPKFTPPRVFSYISKLDYPYDVVYADSLLFISLDFFLGKTSPFYQTFPSYISATFEPKYLIRQLAYGMVERMVPKMRLNTVLDGMIYEGKKILLTQALMPEASVATLMKYSEEQLNWCKRNEKQLWSYFVSKEIFYKPYAREAHRFLKEAPFSKFYLDIDRSSPGRVGVWLGYRILRSYMQENPEVGLMEVIEQIDATWLFRNAGYHPQD